MKNFKRGDTLIEVLFAFMIISLIIGVAFTGALSAFKTSQDALNRTLATFLVQYQADGLRAYRDSLDWDSTGGYANNFLGGTAASPAVYKDSSNKIALPSGSQFPGTYNVCMDQYKDNTTSKNYWKINSSASAANCTAIAKALARGLTDPILNIYMFYDTTNASLVKANITVSWQAANTNIREQVTNTVILTREK